MLVIFLLQVGADPPLMGAVPGRRASGFLSSPQRRLNYTTQWRSDLPVIF